LSRLTPPPHWYLYWGFPLKFFFFSLSHQSGPPSPMPGNYLQSPFRFFFPICPSFRFFFRSIFPLFSRIVFYVLVPSLPSRAFSASCTFFVHTRFDRLQSWLLGASGALFSPFYGQFMIQYGHWIVVFLSWFSPSPSVHAFFPSSFFFRFILLWLNRLPQGFFFCVGVFTPFPPFFFVVFGFLTLRLLLIFPPPCCPDFPGFFSR